MSHFTGMFVEGADAGPLADAGVYASVTPAVGSGARTTGSGTLLEVDRLVQ